MEFQTSMAAASVASRFPNLEGRAIRMDLGRAQGLSYYFVGGGLPGDEDRDLISLPSWSSPPSRPGTPSLPFVAKCGRYLATGAVRSSDPTNQATRNPASGAATSVAAGGSPSCVVAVDLDGDTRLDLVVGNAGTNDVTVLHNNGAGGFTAFGVNVGAPPSWLTVADLDHDGHLDITAASANAFVTTMLSAR